MEHALVTGCAGFIGSHLSEKLLRKGYQVTGVDCFVANYDRKIKEKNLARLQTHSRFRFIEQEILKMDLNDVMDKVNLVFHQAAMPGVRSSWGQEFDHYVRHNVLATQSLLETAKDKKHIEKFIYASSSSVYGEMKGPTDESKLPQPISPYGVSKLSGEHLCHLYYKNFQVPTISLRYFTVYGERQRPDMAFHKFIKRALLEEPIDIYGDGTQTRDFTYVDDAVEANLLALKHGREGEVYNIGGDSPISVNEVIDKIEKIVGKPVHRHYMDAIPGDPRHTRADIGKAQNELGYQPQWKLEDGLKEEIRYIKQLYQF
ncbi:MAG: NAD-dependent epimerase/dehydratase family protein [Bacillaceae bacterium]|nr:NAD-dependent epimerase/dehydratase family protein [Bacillaceae bacterium]